MQYSFYLLPAYTRAVSGSLMFKYQHVVNQVSNAIESGLLVDKLDSVRKYAKNQGLGVSTVTQAYSELERQGWIIAQPKRGYFVNQYRSRSPKMAQPDYGQTINRVKASQSLKSAVQFSFNDPDILPLSCTAPSSVLDHEPLLNRLHRQVIALRPYKLLMEAPIEGIEPLRLEICRYFLSVGQSFSAKQILVTNGRKEGLLLALLAANTMGASVAVESPVSFYFQVILAQFNIDVVEIPAQIDYEQELALLSAAYQIQPFSSYLVNPSFADPTGRVLSDENKIALIKWATEYQVILIEYDRSELHFAQQRPRSLASLAVNESQCKIISIGDFYDTISPAVSLGYIICINTFDACQFTKQVMAEEPSVALQMMVHKMLASGQYLKLMHKLRLQLAKQYQLSHQILSHGLTCALAQGLYMSQPLGGPCIWFKLPRGLSSEALWHRVIAKKFSIAPGQMFTFNEGENTAYKDCFRITFALPWNEQMEGGVKRLAEIIECFVEEHACASSDRD
jgi:DNA-binding transcriptional MocR family regulator